MRLQDLTGQVFGRLTVIERGDMSTSNKTMWVCRCECGSEFQAIANNLKNGRSKSCGCRNANFHDLTGQIFGRLLVVEQVEPKTRRGKWLCQCECGNLCQVDRGKLESMNTKSCGCLRFNNPALGFIDLTGQRFGRLLVLERTSNTGRTTRWLCQCDCGELRKVCATSLRNGGSKSCGCMSVETTVARSTKHGHARRDKTDGEYSIWSAMKQRCNNPKDAAFKNYGGRGIKVCVRWDSSFENFLADMGERPFPKASLERLDNGEGYSKENCKWATRKEQGRNTRSNRIVEYQGISKTVAGWAEETGMKYDVLHNRLTNSKMTIDEAFETPVRKCKP